MLVNIIKDQKSPSAQNATVQLSGYLNDSEYNCFPT